MYPKISLLFWAFFAIPLVAVSFATGQSPLSFNASSAFADLLTPPSGPNPGKRSTEESNFLIKEAETAGAHGDYEQQVRSLERFLARYPSDTRAASANLDLLKAYSSLKNYNGVIRLAKQSLHLKLPPEAEMTVKLDLASAYLGLKRYADAEMTTTEVIKEAAGGYQKHPAQELKLEALIGLKKVKDAKALLDSMKTESKTTELSQLKSAEQRIKTLECEGIPTPNSKTEDDLLAYYASKTTCLSAIAPFVKSPDQLDALQTWCEVHDQVVQEANHSDLKKFAKEKVLQDLKSASEDLSCHGFTTHKK